MTRSLFNGLPPKVVTYIKVHLRFLYSTGLFNYQEREDLIQDLVLFYLEFLRKRGDDISDNLLFMAIKSKAMHLSRARLQEMQSGFLNQESLNDMYENKGFEPEANFSLADLETKMTIREVTSQLSEKEQKFIKLLEFGETTRSARRKAKVSNNVVENNRKKLKKKKF